MFGFISRKKVIKAIEHIVNEYDDMQKLRSSRVPASRDHSGPRYFSGHDRTDGGCCNGTNVEHEGVR